MYYAWLWELQVYTYWSPRGIIHCCMKTTTPRGPEDATHKLDDVPAEPGHLLLVDDVTLVPGLRVLPPLLLQPLHQPATQVEVHPCG